MLGEILEGCTSLVSTPTSVLVPSKSPWLLHVRAVRSAWPSDRKPVAQRTTFSNERPELVGACLRSLIPRGDTQAHSLRGPERGCASVAHLLNTPFTGLPPSPVSLHHLTLLSGTTLHNPTTTTNAGLRAHRALWKTKGLEALLPALPRQLGWRVTWLHWSEATACTFESG